ncbi:MAG: hypothetical protein AAGM38_03325 [Pseudomonadota bacterium]
MTSEAFIAAEIAPRRFSFGAVLALTLREARRRFCLYLALVLLASAPSAGLYLITGFDPSPEQAAAEPLRFWGTLALFSLAGAPFTGIMLAGFAYAGVRGIEGEPVSLGTALRAGVGRLGYALAMLAMVALFYVAALLLAGAIGFAGAVSLVPMLQGAADPSGALMLLVLLCLGAAIGVGSVLAPMVLLSPAALAKPQWPAAAMAECWRLARGHRGVLVSVLLSILLVLGALGVAQTLLAPSVADAFRLASPQQAQMIVGAIIGLPVSVLVGVMPIAAYALLTSTANDRSRLAAVFA